MEAWRTLVLGSGTEGIWKGSWTEGHSHDKGWGVQGKLQGPNRPILEYVAGPSSCREAPGSKGGWMRWFGLFRRIESTWTPKLGAIQSHIWFLGMLVHSLTRMCLQPQLCEGKKENQREGSKSPNEIPLNNPLLLPPMLPFPISVQFNISHAKDHERDWRYKGQETTPSLKGW